jgi:SHS2 domain-containing protein
MFTEIEHTADYAIQVSSPDLKGLFEDAAWGMYSLTGGHVPSSPTVREIELSAPDVETLLVGWLEELSFLLEIEGEMMDDVSFQYLRPTELLALLKTGPAAGVTKLIKAVTFHDLEIRMSAQGCVATIVFDV